VLSNSFRPGQPNTVTGGIVYRQNYRGDTCSKSANLVLCPLCLLLQKMLHLAVITHLFFQPLAELLMLLYPNEDFVMLENRVLLKMVLLHVFVASS